MLSNNDGVPRWGKKADGLLIILQFYKNERIASFLSKKNMNHNIQLSTNKWQCNVYSTYRKSRRPARTGS